MKLRNKSVLVFFLTAIIPILAVSLITLHISHELLQESIGHDFADIAHEKSLSIATILKNRLFQAKIIADSEHLKEAVRKSKECALAYAKHMNYDTFSLDIHVRDRSAPTAFDSELYIDTSVVAVMRY